MPRQKNAWEPLFEKPVKGSPGAEYSNFWSYVGPDQHTGARTVIGHIELPEEPHLSLKKQPALDALLKAGAGLSWKAGDYEWMLKYKPRETASKGQVIEIEGRLWDGTPAFTVWRERFVKMTDPRKENPWEPLFDKARAARVQAYRLRRVATDHHGAIVKKSWEREITIGVPATLGGGSFEEAIVSELKDQDYIPLTFTAADFDMDENADGVVYIEIRRSSGKLDPLFELHPITSKGRKENPWEPLFGSPAKEERGLTWNLVRPDGELVHQDVPLPMQLSYQAVERYMVDYYGVKPEAIVFMGRGDDHHEKIRISWPNKSEFEERFLILAAWRRQNPFEPLFGMSKLPKDTPRSKFRSDTKFDRECMRKWKETGWVRGFSVENKTERSKAIVEKARAAGYVVKTDHRADWFYVGPSDPATGGDAGFRERVEKIISVIGATAGERMGRQLNPWEPLFKSAAAKKIIFNVYRPTGEDIETGSIHDPATALAGWIEIPNDDMHTDPIRTALHRKNFLSRELAMDENEIDVSIYSAGKGVYASNVDKRTTTAGGWRWMYHLRTEALSPDTPLRMMRKTNPWEPMFSEPKGSRTGWRKWYVKPIWSGKERSTIYFPDCGPSDNEAFHLLRERDLLPPGLHRSQMLLERAGSGIITVAFFDGYTTATVVEMNKAV